MRIIIFDDDAWLADDAFRILSDVVKTKNHEKEIEILKFVDAGIFKTWIEGNKTDVAVLDISIPGNENFGIECAKVIRNKNKQAHIVFLTSDESKIYSVFGGLIRPTQFIVKDGANTELADALEDILGEMESQDDTIKVSFGRSEYLIASEEIISLCKTGRKTVIALENREIEVTESLSAISEKLEENFKWVDKGTIVNIRKVVEANYPEKKLTMTDGNVIYMSRNSARELKKCLAGITR